MRAHLVLLTAAFAISVAFPSDAGAQIEAASIEAASIILRASRPARTELQDVLVEIGEKVTRQVPAKTNPYDVLKGFCGGSYTNDYFEHVKKLNPQFVFSRAASERSLVLPACLKVSKHVVVKALQGDSIDSIIRRHLGVEPDEVLAPCATSSRPAKAMYPKTTGNSLPCSNQTLREVVASRNGGKDAALKTLKAGDPIFLSNVTRATTIPLLPGVSSTEALTKVMSAANVAAVPVADTSPDLRLLRPLTSGDKRVQKTACAPDGATLGRPWPFDEKVLRETLEFSKREARKRNLEIGPVVIRIADTGVMGLESYFPKEALSVNGREKPNQSTDSDINGFNGDHYGIAASGNGDVTPYGDDPDRDHGTQVTDLALGGAKFRKGYPAIHDLVKVDFAKIFWRPGNAVIVNHATVLSAIGAINNHVTPGVVNLSVGGADKQNTQQFERQIILNGLNLLVVLAAGNNSDDIGKNPIYPASFGGTGSAADWILTVGASNPRDERAAFSNYSRDRVDVFAPGCRIEFIGPNGQPQYLHGTSFAAPLVSLAAGLIRALGVSDARQVKLRIIASADFDTNLSKVARYGSILNVERAVALFQDSVRVRGADKDIRGVWQTPDSGAVDLCDEPDGITAFAVKRILKVDTYNANGGPLRLKILTVGGDGRLNSADDCSPNGSGVVFIDDKNIKIPIPWTKLKSLTPAFRF